MQSTKINRAMRLKLEASMGKVGFALNQLMSRPKVPYNIGKKLVTLDPEQRLSIAFSDELRSQTIMYYESGGEQGCRAIWTHCANERQAGWFTMILLRAMGMLKGAHDFWFVWEDGGGLIELKVDGDLTLEQEYFQRWARAFKAKTAVCRTVDDAINTLVIWGAIKPVHGASGLN